MQKIERVTLKNGLEVNFLFDKKFTTSSVQMMFKIGWRNDTESERGLAHLFEHLVGKRTKKYPGKSEFAKKLDELGIVTNASTGPDMTIYYQNQTNENILPSLSMLFEAIYNTNFLEEDLEKEKQVVLNEAREYLDNDDSILWRQTMLNLFPGTSMEKFFFGDKETMKNITLKHFEDFYNIYKNPKNSVLFIGTNSTKHKKKILDFLNKFYLDSNNKKLFSNAKIPSYKDRPKEIIKSHKINKPDRVQSNLRIAYRVGAMNKKERVVFGVINSILLGGFSGTIIQKLRDDLGMIYWANLGRNVFLQNIRYVSFATGCDKNNKEIVIEKTKETIQETIKNVTEKDVKRTIPIKEFRQKTPVYVYDDVDRLIDSVMYKVDYLQTPEYLKLLKSVNIKDIKNLMSKIFVEENCTICVLE